MTGFQESDPGVEGRRFEAFQMATSGAWVGKGSSFRVGSNDPKMRSWRIKRLSVLLPICWRFQPGSPPIRAIDYTT